MFSFIQDAEGPLSDKAHAIDRAQLPSYIGRIRRFHPNELLAISGFPAAFIWPEEKEKGCEGYGGGGKVETVNKGSFNMSLGKKCGVVGNSVNVTVVRAVMQALFGPPTP